MSAGVAGAPAMENSQPTLVADEPALRELGYRLDDAQRSVLSRGGVLVPSPSLVDSTGHVRLVVYDIDYSGSTPQVKDVQTRRVLAAPIAPLRVGRLMPKLTGAILTPATAAALKLGWTQDGGVLSSSATALSRDAQDKLEQSLLGSAQFAAVYTERGFDESFTLPLIGLVIIAALAVLVGTLTATGLALVDGRPDAATLAAVGARPRTRRTMAAAQAVVIGLLGSLAGIAVGVVPGIAVTWPLTAARTGPDGGSVWGSPIIHIPWSLLVLIGIGVPLLAALAAGLGVRSRLPLTRRLGQ
jgi:putative ABC transport system permease protein